MRSTFMFSSREMRLSVSSMPSAMMVMPFSLVTALPSFMPARARSMGIFCICPPLNISLLSGWFSGSGTMYTAPGTGSTHHILSKKIRQPMTTKDTAATFLMMFGEMY